MNDTKITNESVSDKVRVSEPFTIGANEVVEIPFSFTLPFYVPVSYGKTKVWITTGADIKNAVDPTDQDYIIVEPSRFSIQRINRFVCKGSLCGGCRGYRR